MPKQKVNKDFIKTAVAKAGGQVAIAKQIGVCSQAVSRWFISGNIPAKRVIPIEKLTGISRHDLRPDLYPRES
jgi:DNA-binding transcriptional regulator YdaS (Cro superfamily)